MRFGLLGADEDAMRLCAAATEHPEHEFTVAYDSAAFTEELMREGVVVRDGSWEDLLHAPECDAVVVGRGSNEELRAEQLRKLVQAAVPLVVVHPAGNMLLCFELQMIQQDAGSPIVPYFPGLENSFLNNWGPFGATATNQSAGEHAPLTSPDVELKQVLFEREVISSSQESVTDQFARDALLLRRWVGLINRVGALGANPYPSDDWGNLSVHMTAGDGVIARWSASPTSDDNPANAAGQVTAVWRDGKSTLRIPIGIDSWRAPSGEPVPPEDVWALDLIASPSQRPVADGIWEDACRAIEVSDTLDPSYRRGKTIQLFHEKHTEEETFKGMMAAGGCLTMMFVIFLLPMLAAVDSLKIPFFQGEGWHRWPWKALHYRTWPLYLSVGLGIFLSLQLLRLVFRKDRDQTNS